VTTSTLVHHYFFRIVLILRIVIVFPARHQHRNHAIFMSTNLLIDQFSLLELLLDAFSCSHFFHYILFFIRSYYSYSYGPFWCETMRSPWWDFPECRSAWRGCNRRRRSTVATVDSRRRESPILDSAASPRSPRRRYDCVRFRCSSSTNIPASVEDRTLAEYVYECRMSGPQIETWHFTFPPFARYLFVPIFSGKSFKLMISTI